MSAVAVQSRSSLWFHLIFIAALTANIAFWLHARKVLPVWDNVPPAPRSEATSFSGLGDPEIAYRLIGYFLQNLGNTGGNFMPLKDYDYTLLEKWFFTAQALDVQANYVPMLAAYYFGGVDGEPEKISHVVTYLASAGQAPYPQKWRWLAHAVYLARYQEKNLPRALALAYTLANLKTDTAPWAKQMPAFVQLQIGNKQASYELMLQMLKTEGTKLAPQEVNTMRSFICDRTLSPAEAAKNPLCQDLK